MGTAGEQPPLRFSYEYVLDVTAPSVADTAAFLGPRLTVSLSFIRAALDGFRGAAGEYMASLRDFTMFECCFRKLHLRVEALEMLLMIAVGRPSLSAVKYHFTGSQTFV